MNVLMIHLRPQKNMLGNLSMYQYFTILYNSAVSVVEFCSQIIINRCKKQGKSYAINVGIVKHSVRRHLCNIPGSSLQCQCLVTVRKFSTTGQRIEESAISDFW